MPRLSEEELPKCTSQQRLPNSLTPLGFGSLNRAFVYKGFLTPDECDHLITLAKDKLEKSMVVDNESGESVESEVRTSSGMFLSKAQDEVVSSVEARIAAWTFLPEENGESMQILHYENGQKYEPHHEISIDDMSIKNPENSEDQIAYEGPNFHDLDENLRNAFHKYLEIRGVKPSTTNFLHEYMINKDSREYVGWLKNLKNFIDA